MYDLLPRGALPPATPNSTAAAATHGAAANVRFGAGGGKAARANEQGAASQAGHGGPSLLRARAAPAAGRLVTPAARRKEGRPHTYGTAGATATLVQATPRCKAGAKCSLVCRALFSPAARSPSHRAGRGLPASRKRRWRQQRRRKAGGGSQAAAAPHSCSAMRSAAARSPRPSSPRASRPSCALRGLLGVLSAFFPSRSQAFFALPCPALPCPPFSVF